MQAGSVVNIYIYIILMDSLINDCIDSCGDKLDHNADDNTGFHHHNCPHCASSRNYNS